MLNVLSLFSGIGAFEKALENLGIPHKVVAYCEIDKYASKAYSIIHDIPEEKNLQDVTKVDILDIEELACRLIKLLHIRYPQALKDRYGIDTQEELQGYELLELAGRKRGFLVSGGEINTERMAKVLVEEYRSGKLGRFTLEEPGEKENV